MNRRPSKVLVHASTFTWSRKQQKNKIKERKNDEKCSTKTKRTKRQEKKWWKIVRSAHEIISEQLKSFRTSFFSIDFDLNSNSLFLSYNWQVWIDGGEHLTVGRTINKVMRWRKWRLHEKKAKIRNGKSIERVIISIENYLFSSLTVPTAAIKIEFLVRFQPRSETEKERKRLC